MSSTEISQDGQAGRPRADRIVRAAIAAFCSLTRPARRDAAQLDDLVMPLFGSLGPETLRWLSATLSECMLPPERLVAELAAQPIEIAAPLLARSPALEEADLVDIATRLRGGHARVIVSRAGLGVRARAIAFRVAMEIEDIGRIEAVEPSTSASGKEAETVMSSDPKPAAPLRTPLSVAGENAENVRRKLRAMMAPAAETSSKRVSIAGAPAFPPAHYPTLRAAALTGVPALFQTALADALGLDFQRARALFGQSGYFELLAALRALDLVAEQAFVLAAAAYPGQFAHAEAIRLFLERFDLLHVEAARDRIRAWKAEAVAATVRALPSPGKEAGNDRAAPQWTTALRA